MSSGNDMAFPVLDRAYTPNDTTQLGLTKRELFAMAAMQGLLSNSGGPIQANRSNGWSLTNCTREQVAGAACRFADDLLTELAKPTLQRDA